MSAFFSGVGVILFLELRQRVRGVAWYVLLSLFVALIAIVTVLLSIAFGSFNDSAYNSLDPGAAQQDVANAAVYSTIIYFVLLLGTLVAPALSGNAINGDRDAGTLATTQVTLATTWQIVLGKFLASWITALAFLAAAVPFLIYASIAGGLGWTTIVVSVLVLAVELGVVAAIGVGLSGILNRPLFSIVVTYLVVAALSIGTLIAFTLGGITVQSDVEYEQSYPTQYGPDGSPTECSTETIEQRVPRFDYFWGVLVANPYILLADAVPTEFTADGNANDLFGFIKVGVRSAQISPERSLSFNQCDETFLSSVPTAEETINSTVPGWFVGLIIHVLLAAGALTGAWARTRTPAGRLSRGSRIA